MPNLHIERLSSQELPGPSILSRMRDLAFTLSRDGRSLVAMNRRAHDLFGWAESEIRQFHPWWQAVLTPSSGRQLEQVLASIDQEPPALRSLKLNAVTVGGTHLPIRLHSIFLSPETMLILADYTIDDSEAEEILRQTQARFRSIVDSLSINLVLKNKEGRRLYANQAYLRLRSFQLADIIGKTDDELFPPDVAAQLRRDDQAVLQSGRILHKFEEHVSADGQRSWTEVIKGPLRDADNQINGVQILFWDATERKLAEQAFERERNLLHALLDNVPDSIYFKDSDSRFVRISRGMAKKFNLDDPAGAIGKTDADIFTGEHAAQARSDELRIMQTGEPIVALVERETWPDRPDTWCSSTKLPLRDANNNVVGTFGISRDITDLIKAEQELREARDLADQANRAKSEFLANMSHEIRTPMNGVIGMAELLRNTPLNDAQQSFLEMIDQSAQSLLRIINDILDFSKIEAGKLDLEAIPFDLRKCVSHAAKSLAARAAQKGIELILKLDPDVPDHVIGDAVRLRQVLVNLVGNAIKYTDDGEIVVRVSVADGPPVAENYTLHFAVSDTGIGIPPEKHQAIFEAFAQADVSTTRQYGGTGLGLSISGQLVDMMHGRMWLESEVGIGSTFHFSASFPPASEASVDTDENGDVPQAAQLEGMPLLLIDDNTTSRETLASALTRRGLRVTAVASPDEAEDAYSRVFARCGAGEGTLIVDQTLGLINGLDLVEQLHPLLPTQRPITILLATAANPIAHDVARLYNVDEVLQKPALQSEICAAIRRVLQPAPREPASAATSAPTPSGLHFLLAEDGLVNQAVFKGLLATRGHQVTVAQDGIEAVEAWRQGSFDAVFMDVQMPNVDGLEATRMIRAQEQECGVKRTPIIAITAGALDSDQQQCFEAGMDEYLTKPIDFDQLDRVLNHLRLGGASMDATTTANQLVHDRPTNHDINLNAPLAKLKCTADQHRQLVKTLGEELRQRLNEISQAFENQNDKLLVRASHSLKSAAALFEASRVVSIASTIEQHARSGASASAQQHFAKLRETTIDILAAIDAWLAGK